MPGTMSATIAFIISTTLVATIVAASFESLQGPYPFSTTSERSSNALRSVPGKRARSSGASTTAETPVRLCGMRLFDAVRTICGGFFTGYSRRSDPAMTVSMSNLMSDQPSSYPTDITGEYLPTQLVFGDDGLSGDDSDSDNVVWARSPKAMALRLLTEGNKVHHRYRRDLVEECCRRPCAVSSLVKYCGRQT